MVEAVDRDVRSLVVATDYPSPDDVYRRGFIHTRVKYYRASGRDVRVFVVSWQSDGVVSYEHEGVPVTVGNEQALRRLIRDTGVTRLLIHNLTPRIADVMREVADQASAVVWFHGHGAEAWHRRWYNHIGDAKTLEKWLSGRHEETARVRELTAQVFADESLSLEAVFVSRWFRDHVFGPDMGFLPHRSHIIHNMIDCDHYAYRPKSPQDRLRILLLRPFTSRTYGNDLAVEAILRLRNRPWFDELSFTLAGDGPLWDEVTAEISGLPNVKLRRGFVRQAEIPALHAAHGVFLVPSRKDSQGVSRDEAMSSGLVPVSNAVDAVPEFVSDGKDGLLAPVDSVAGIANAIERLHESPDEFLAMSEAAARRVRRQSAQNIVGPAELSVIEGTADALKSEGIAKGRGDQRNG